jgi:hypothetical protein
MRVVISALIVSVVMTHAARDAHAQIDIDNAPISYSSDSADNAIVRLQSALDAGKKKLLRDKRFGYLPAVLSALSVPVETQSLVFSKTSFQARLISPDNARAIYFGDDIYVGWVPGSDVVEVAAVDNEKGTLFYTLEQRDAVPRFERRDHECLQCHASALTRGIPGHIVRSVHPDNDGFPIMRHGSTRVEHTTPIASRWGGWYVTGAVGKNQHLGNLTFDPARPPETFAGSPAMTRLSPGNYPTGTSDIVALMVLEHQLTVHNLIASASFGARQALHHDGVMRELLEEKGNALMASTARRIDSAVKPLVDALLLVDEAGLTFPVKSPTPSPFEHAFMAKAARDSKGRSLRDLDLDTRLFRYPLSFLITSDAFAKLPEAARSRALTLVGEVLMGRNPDRKYAHLNAPRRQAILEILRATWRQMPAGWRTPPG